MWTLPRRCAELQERLDIGKTKKGAAAATPILFHQYQNQSVV
ncbi:MAG: hypothetical protein RL367_2824, partial [Pseudomonadota bacterium]